MLPSFKISKLQVTKKVLNKTQLGGSYEIKQTAYRRLSQFLFKNTIESFIFQETRRMNLQSLVKRNLPLTLRPVLNVKKENKVWPFGDKQT